jgi:hypothetical protein
MRFWSKLIPVAVISLFLCAGPAYGQTTYKDPNGSKADNAVKRVHAGSNSSVVSHGNSAAQRKLLKKLKKSSKVKATPIKHQSAKDSQKGFQVQHTGE